MSIEAKKTIQATPAFDERILLPNWSCSNASVIAKEAEITSADSRLTFAAVQLQRQRLRHIGRDRLRLIQDQSML